jgi:hypothetical protein
VRRAGMVRQREQSQGRLQGLRGGLPGWTGEFSADFWGGLSGERQERPNWRRPGLVCGELDRWGKGGVGVMRECQGNQGKTSLVILAHRACPPEVHSLFSPSGPRLRDGAIKQSKATTAEGETER